MSSDQEEQLGKRFAGKEHVLNHAAQRWHLTRPKSVGGTMELIRECQPDSFKEWESYYWEKAYTKTKEPAKVTKELIEEIGTRLFEKIKGVVIPEWTKAFETITLGDCIDYIIEVTINRTYSGFQREKSVVHDNLAHIFPQITFEESDPELDHAGSIDYIGKVNGKDMIIGIQIKPITGNFAHSGYKPSDRMKSSFAEFKKKFGGSVFIVFSEKEKILNLGVIEEIAKEIA
jgi:MjaI restriction endonuclease